MTSTKRDQILRLLKKTRVLRPLDVEAIGISRTYLNKLHAEGVLDRPSRGLYVLRNDEPSEQRSLVEACTANPHEAWMKQTEVFRLPQI